jgi:hypothetical protein
VALGSLTGGYGPSTPLPLALSAMLALIPLPDDPDPKGENSTWNRRIQAHKFAQAAFEALDNETELVDSIITPRMLFPMEVRALIEHHSIRTCHWNWKPTWR